MPAMAAHVHVFYILWIEKSA